MTILILLSILASPLLFTFTSITSWFQAGIKPLIVKRVSAVSAYAALAASALLIFILLSNGPVQSPLLGVGGIGISLRIDSVSVIMFVMISILSAVILRYSGTYMDGDERQGAFIGRLTAAIASVQLLVLAGNLALLLFAWIFTSISLQRLLIFYHNRSAAVIASKKKFIMARLSDLFLAIGVILLYQKFHTADLSRIFQEFREIGIQGMDLTLTITSICLAMAAIFKSAQFPTHGWLIEVMETPTPVSALLHAGLLNAGPFLIIRFAWLFEANATASTILMIIGGITALFGSWVYITQTSVKTSLAYSSIAHMGFSLMVCGLGAFPAAMLHLVAHSFYKAHSFLSSGSVVEQIKGSFPSVAKRSGKLKNSIAAIIASAATFILLSYLAGINIANNPALLFISSIVVLGSSMLITPNINAPLRIVGRSVLMVIVIMGSFLTLESLSSIALSNSVPSHHELSAIQFAVLGILALCFWLSLFIQTHSDRWLTDPRFKALSIHLKNGFYINIYLDKWIGAHKIHKKARSQTEYEAGGSWVPENIAKYRKQSA